MLTRRSAPALELNRVAVATRRFSGSTAPTATSGVSMTERILGGRAARAYAFFKSLALKLGLGVARAFVLSDSLDAAVTLEARDFLPPRGEFVELDRRCLDAVGEGASLGDGARLILLLFSTTGDVVTGESSHCKCMMTFFVAH